MINTTPVIYFTIGFISGILCFLTIGLTLRGEKEEKEGIFHRKRKWDKLEKINMEFETEYCLKKETSTATIAYALCEVLKRKIEKDSELYKVNIAPGDYDLKINVTTNFIKRGELEKHSE